MSNQHWVSDWAPPEAYYNRRTSSALKDYEALYAKHPDHIITSWSTRYVQLWDLISNADKMLGIPLMPPPPLEIDRSDNIPIIHNPDGTTTEIVGHMTESWVDTKDGGDAKISNRVFYQLRLYEKTVKEEIEGICGKTPTSIALHAVLDRLIFHESAHYIRNTMMWRACYDENMPGTYEECYDRLDKFVGSMGCRDDEKETEALALKLFRTFYYPCGDGMRGLVPAMKSPWIAQYVKRYPNVIDAALVYGVYVYNWDIHYGDLSDKDRRKAEDKRWELIQKIRKHGDKNGKKYHLIQ